ncbi:MAG: hypothetical protein UY13_C0002G0181 [Candidatus Pacebacteria bacterium GW2011_GWB1_47_8]|nr:MAG: hypothetical protein UX28_C0001G0330 [Candidatus Pacebacteria bacterium GW2011_GWA1_46_10]KKU84269.1 MAG: hypothetical protein UY13_C0002G0181 [Candidatus Pacebacteria bacterium GW2011_GWB1_47_8]HCR81489.1 hypothetical protein [Candidatus Paceibacterota bacterium]
MKKIFTHQTTKIITILIAAIIVLTGWSYFFEVQLRPSNRLAQLISKTAQSTPTTELTAQTLAAQVVPAEGYTVVVNWGDTGQKLVAAGGIDLAKYQQNYDDPQYTQLMTYLTSDNNKSITINKDTAYFWVNTLWALGLTQRSDVLDKGVMGTQYKDRVGNFASTGGWTLGAKDAVKLYSSADIIPLTNEQQVMVDRIAQNIYRPCCGNPTSFPDCNHGMAILGLIELMVSQDYNEEDIYRAALAFNSYWFSQTYIDLAYYFQTKENTAWADVDPKRALSAEFSSAQGYQQVKKQIGTVPGTQSAGASCGT